MNDRELDKLMSASALRQAKLLTDSIPADDELNKIVASENFKQNMQSIILKSEKRQRRVQGLKYLRKIVACLAIVAIVSFGAIMSADANRANFFQFFERSFNISGQQSEGWDKEFNAQVVENSHDVYLPSWMPSGVKAIQSSQENKQCIITYKSDNQTIRFFQYDRSANILNDNKVESMEKITIQNQIYYYSQKNRSGSITRMLIWATDNNDFELDSTGSKDELFKVAQSLVFKKG